MRAYASPLALCLGLCPNPEFRRSVKTSTNIIMSTGGGRGQVWAHYVHDRCPQIDDVAVPRMACWPRRAPKHAPSSIRIEAPNA